jgi:hypothetical protein
MVLGLLGKADIGDDGLAVWRGVEKLANADFEVDLVNFEVDLVSGNSHFKVGWIGPVALARHGLGEIDE